jgi:SAM-dependent methyltransferase
MASNYIHGQTTSERERLALMNSLINEGCLDALALTGDERRVLDVGCGTGQFTRLLAGRLGAESVLVALERDGGQLDAARRLFESDTPDCTVEFRQGDAASAAWPPAERGRFDLAHTRFLLEHVPDPAIVVRNMLQAVRPGGRIVLLDDDHDLLRLWPEPPGVAKAWEAYWRSYYRLGTDPLVGRKLCALLAEAGAQPTRNTQVFYGACAGDGRFGGIVDNLLAVLAGARDTVLAAAEIDAPGYDTALEAFRAFRDEPAASVWYPINLAEGTRPDADC